MELARMTNTERLKLCRRYFFFGFLALPFLWMVNTVWFGIFLVNFNSYKMQQQRQQQLRQRLTQQRQQRESGSRQPSSHSSPNGPPNAANASTSSASSGSSAQANVNIQQQRQQSLDPETMNHLKAIRSLVIYSFIGSMIWIVALFCWIVTFQIKRAEWGELGDQISFNIPRGIP